jgi:CheY-like chemotaxis protein
MISGVEPKMHENNRPRRVPLSDDVTNTIGLDGKAINVLLVEDSLGDIRLTQEAFRESNNSVVLHVARDGIEAMAFLKRERVHGDTPRPDLILLDLNMPKMDGREVLARLKADEDLNLIPIVILTTSDSEADIVKSYQLKANCYLSKPVELDAFEKLVASINDFWLMRAKLPRGAQSTALPCTVQLDPQRDGLIRL